MENKDSYVVTETTFDPKTRPEEVVGIVRGARATGQLVFHISQGGIQKVSLVEKSRSESV
jgi:hypothetical protein